jgi:hypothetical protein
MKLYLDDIRNPKVPEEWCIVRTAEEAIRMLETGKVDFISFDHDLGTELTGYDVAKAIEELVYYGRIKCPEYNVHSANPVGANNIRAAMEAIKHRHD